MSERNTLILGCGKMVRNVHLKAIAAHTNTSIVALIEPSIEAATAAMEKLKELGMAKPPPHFTDLEAFLASGIAADTAFIATPHKFHCRNILDCLENGFDVLVEKPMVLNAVEARQVIAKRDESVKTVVVGFQGGLSQEAQDAKAMIRQGEIGQLVSVIGTVHQGWKKHATGTWRMEPDISGGGFLFDTGSHLINTMVHVVDSEVEGLGGILDFQGSKVEINAAINGRFKNGVLYTVNMSGDTYGCDGYIDLVGTEGIIRLGMWGHIFCKTRENVGKSMEDLKPATPETTWERFNKILDGEQENTSPPEVGLRFAQFMDLLREKCVKVG